MQKIIRMVLQISNYKKKRQKIIKIQSWIRRSCVRNQYLQVLSFIILIQSCLRRYSSQIIVYEMMKKMWKKKEKKIISALVIQCKFRIFSARKRIKLISQNFLLRDRAALAIQKNWYKFKNGFSGFLLLSAYRARQITDLYIYKQSKKRKKNINIIKIQQLFRKYIKRKFHLNVIIIQKYYRRFTCLNNLIKMRKIKTAGRRIKFWMKAMMKKRNKIVRILQRIWWSKVPGRLYRHLHGKGREKKRDEMRGEERRREEKRRSEKK